MGNPFPQHISRLCLGTSPPPAGHGHLAHTHTLGLDEEDTVPGCLGRHLGAVNRVADGVKRGVAPERPAA
jgi:hypothetical protein